MIDKLKSDVWNDLNEKVEEIYLKYQDRLYIKCGDIEPMQAFKQDDIVDALATMITNVLVSEIGQGVMIMEYTWDEICEMAEDKGFGDPELTAKDNARYFVDCFVEEVLLEDSPELDEIPEETIEDYCNEYKIRFNERGSVMSFVLDGKTHRYSDYITE